MRAQETWRPVVAEHEAREFERNELAYAETVLDFEEADSFPWGDLEVSE